MEEFWKLTILNYLITGLAADKLVEKAKELNDQIRRLEGDKYDLEQRFKRQQYDVINYFFST